MAYPADTDAIERRNAGKSLRDYNRAIANEYGALYERYMRQRFLPRSIERIAPTCRPGDEAPNGRYAKEYDSKNDSSGRTDNANYCRAQGSWYYSAQDLAQLARTIEFSNRFIEDSTRALLFQSWLPNNRLIYWRLFSNSMLALDPGGGGSYRGHGGTARFGSRAILIRLPFNYVGVGVTNSPELSSTQLANHLLRAFYNATREWTEWDVDRPGMNLESLFLARPDPELCRIACRDEPRCKAWTYVKPGIQHGSAAKCWLKSGIPAVTTSTCCNSGVKGIAYGTDRPGADYQDFAVGRNDAALCRAACGLDTKCKAWAFVMAVRPNDTPRCWLKDRVPARRAASCCASGRSP
jgi:hypothetical protein